MPDRVHHVEALPAESVSSEVPIGGCRGEYGTSQIELVDDGRWTEVEDIHHDFVDLLGRDRLGPKGFDVNRERLWPPDCVGQLDLEFSGDTGRDEVLGGPSRRVGGGAIDLG